MNMVKQNKNIFFGKLQIIFSGFFNNLESVLNLSVKSFPYFDYLESINMKLEMVI